MVKSRMPGLPVFLLGHSAGGVVSCAYVLKHQSELAGLICEDFAFQVPAPDFALLVIKGIGYLAPVAWSSFEEIGNDGDCRLWLLFHQPMA